MDSLTSLDMRRALALAQRTPRYIVGIYLVRLDGCGDDRWKARGLDGLKEASPQRKSQDITPLGRNSSSLLQLYYEQATNNIAEGGSVRPYHHPRCLSLPSLPAIWIRMQMAVRIIHRKFQYCEAPRKSTVSITSYMANAPWRTTIRGVLGNRLAFEV